MEKHEIPARVINIEIVLRLPILLLTSKTKTNAGISTNPAINIFI